MFRRTGKKKRQSEECDEAEAEHCPEGHPPAEEVPMAVPTGTPITFETVSPARMSATAIERFSSRTSPTATTMATPK